MKAIVQDRYGEADVLEFRDVEEPQVGEKDVLIRVRAAGVGGFERPDLGGGAGAGRAIAGGGVDQ